MVSTGFHVSVTCLTFQSLVSKFGSGTVHLRVSIHSEKLHKKHKKLHKTSYLSFKLASLHYYLLIRACEGFDALQSTNWRASKPSPQAKTFAYWVWRSSYIGELCVTFRSDSESISLWMVASVSNKMIMERSWKEMSSWTIASMVNNTFYFIYSCAKLCFNQLWDKLSTLPG